MWSYQERATATVDLWRGLKNVEAASGFLESGGTELAPMSTTTSLEVAVRYSASACSVLLKLETANFRERGADLTFLSAFPNEKEVLYPPLTHLAGAPLAVKHLTLSFAHEAATTI